MHPTNGSDGASVWAIKEATEMKAIKDDLTQSCAVDLVARQLRARIMLRLKYSEASFEFPAVPGRDGRCDALALCKLRCSQHGIV
jgi:hypothetical protein